MLSESFLPFFTWAGTTWLGTTVRDTVWAFPVIETFHLLALAILLGSVLIVNLRAFGVGNQRAEMTMQLEPWIVVSIVVLILSGIPMAMSEPMKCYESYSFPIKMILLVAAIAWHFTLQRRWTQPDAARSNPFRSKVAAGLSILLWASIGIAGKGIPYV
ncbi:MAG TPA: DUF6644 family protein [Bryobacteraceae bacterium]|jgi:hypothetical protein|nr:DUF6644 family protein [Bryobacteraceae bacterium]